MLSEHSSKEDCEKFPVKIKSTATTTTRSATTVLIILTKGICQVRTRIRSLAMKHASRCGSVDKGTGGGETQYECTLQDPSEDYLSGPYGSKEACEYRCGNQWWCTYKYITTDEYEYECVQDNTGAPDNAVSGPHVQSGV